MQVIVTLRDTVAVRPEEFLNVTRIEHGVRFFTIYQSNRGGKTFKWRFPYTSVLYWSEHE